MSMKLKINKKSRSIVMNKNKNQQFKYIETNYLHCILRQNLMILLDSDI